MNGFIPLDCMVGTPYDVARWAGSSELAAKLLQVFADLGREVAGVHLPVRIVRTRAGHWQRSAGAWSWVLEDADRREVGGSQWSATEVVRAHRKGLVSVYSDHDFGGSWTPELIVEPEQRVDSE